MSSIWAREEDRFAAGPPSRIQRGQDSANGMGSSTSYNPPPYNTSMPCPMFGSNLAIFGGNFTQADNVINNMHMNQYDGRPEAFKLLQKHTAPSAFHNSAERFDPPKCHPSTCVAILQEMYDWVMQLDENRQS
ncbi:hypothetical protein BDN70DRAFT_936018 [Pholiota conissans]|uniref:Uncharacterized protein n=1 Tax=Pholiota conissans TaxID=109636 RepID=A0A9P5YSW9_9AGAR|nr:hypothetical protein BDN70DRAFT_936018 [Pholiota conissans]